MVLLLELEMKRSETGVLIVVVSSLQSPWVTGARMEWCRMAARVEE